MERRRPEIIPGAIDREEVARRFGYSGADTVCRAHKRGTLPLPYVVLGGRAWYDVGVVEALARARLATARGQTA